MAPERNHHISKDRSLQFVVIHAGDAAKTRSVKISRPLLVAAGSGIVLCIIAFTVAVILYSPFRFLFPISDVQLSQRYGSQLFEVQNRLTKMSEEVMILQEYNRKLRVALGQDTKSDTAIVDLALSSEKKLEPIVQTEDIVSKPASNGMNETISSTVGSSVSFVKEFSYQPIFPISLPVAGYVSRQFQSNPGHLGVDFAGKIGTLIVAPADGYIVFASWTVDDGYLMMMSHGGGYITVYKHNQSILRGVGDFVKRGETIALLGNSGKTSYGPHLHFELWKDGQPRNPNDYFIASNL